MSKKKTYYIIERQRYHCHYEHNLFDYFYFNEDEELEKQISYKSEKQEALLFDHEEDAKAIAQNLDKLYKTVQDAGYIDAFYSAANHVIEHCW